MNSLNASFKCRMTIACVAAAYCAAAAFAQATIQTYAGNGSPVRGFVDGVPATNASLGLIPGVAIDAAGNLYIVDQDPNNRVYKVDALSKIITQFAGDGAYNAPPGDDGGLATGANLGSPRGVAVDSKGNVYIADTFHHMIRKVDTAGIITRFAGLQWTDGPYPSNGDGGPANQAGIGYSTSLAIDAADNLYMNDRAYDTVRKVDGKTGKISTVAGGGSSLGDGGLATNAQLGPLGLAVDKDGNIYIGDEKHSSVRRVDAATGFITTVAGGGSGGLYEGVPAIGVYLGEQIWGLAIDTDGGLLISSIGGCVLKLSSGVLRFVAGKMSVWGFSGDGGLATDAIFAGPTGVAVDSSGNIYVGDAYNYRVRKITRNTDSIPPVSTATTSPAPNGSGWNKADVSISLGSADNSGGSGVKQIQWSLSGAQSSGLQTVLGNTATTVVSAEGTTTLTYYATDNAGNVETARTLPVRIDKTSPAVSLNGPVNGAAYPLGAAPGASCSSTDTLSGVAINPTLSLSGATANGVGTVTAQCTGASDLAGNTAAPLSITYTVRYGFIGFFPPVSSTELNSAKAGQSVPLKWQLSRSDGSLVTALSTVTGISSASVACVPGAVPGSDVPADTSGASGLRYDTQFVYTWQTNPAWSGSCRRVLLSLDDGTTHTATFTLK